MDDKDLKEASLVHKEAFERQCLFYEWLECNLNAYHRIICYVVIKNSIAGYIIWSQKSGFRRQTVLEVEQIAILKKDHGQVIGRKLIEDSLPNVRN